MKKTYRKTILRTIKSTLSRFLAIFAIVALGVGFLAGLLSSPGDMRLSAERYYDDTDMYDLRIVSTLGLTEEDLKLVRQTERVLDVQPVRDTDLVLLSEEGDSYTSRIHTLPREEDPKLNTPVPVSGRLPEKPGECAVVLTKTILDTQDWIGRTLTPEEDEEGENDDLPERFTVVGTVKSSLYLSMEQEHTTVGTGTVGLILYTVDESFPTDYYTGFYLSLEGAKELDSFGSRYEALTDETVPVLEELGEERSAVRYKEIVGDANQELEDAKKEYEDGKAEAEEKLNDAQKELDDAQREIDENEQKLKDAKTELDNGWAELEDNRASYRAQTASAQAQINDGYAKLKTYQSQLDEARKPLDEAQRKLDDAYEQLDKTDSQLREAKLKLDETEANLAAIEAGKDGLRQLAGSLGLPVSGELTDSDALSLLVQLEAASPELAGQFAGLKAGLEALQAQGTDSAQAAAALEAGRQEYEKNLAAADEARARLEESQRLLTEQGAPIREQQAALDAQKAELDSSASALAQARATAEARFASAEAELSQGQKEYEDGLKKLEDGKKELIDGRKEYEESKAEVEEELRDAEEQIKDAESKIRDIETGQWYVFTREDNTGYSSYGSNADKIAAIAVVFPLFFFLVAALVALTTMTRMVEEERQQIGTLKALGFQSGKIAVKYLFYAAAASLAGSIVGLLFGHRLFPYIIITAYNIMYDIPEALTPFNPAYSLFASLAAILCTLAATFSACRAALREAPASLMLPKAPKAGKRVFLEYITPLWSRLKFTQKVTARNLLRYKKRFFMTVIGISGCTALLVTGFGVKDSISHIVSNQYEELNRYQVMVAVKDESALEGRALQAILNDGERVEGWLPVMQAEGTVVPKAKDPADDVSIFVPSDVERLPDYFTFRHRRGNDPVTYDENAVIITEKLSERQHLKVGDVITVKDQDEREASFTITDICENYVGNTLYLSPAAYEAAFGLPVELNLVLCKLPEEVGPEEEDALAAQLLECRDVAAARFTTELSRSFSNTIRSLDSIVVVLIVSAGALAFVVLYNLININISERQKELATIKVLGFYDGEVSAYVYRETAILTLIGTAVGLLLGMFLHQFVIRTAEIDMVMFGRTVYPLSYLWSTLLTILFSVLVNLVMHRKLKKISMVESMKAPE